MNQLKILMPCPPQINTRNKDVTNYQQFLNSQVHLSKDRASLACETSCSKGGLTQILRD